MPLGNLQPNRDLHFKIRVFREFSSDMKLLHAYQTSPIAFSVAAKEENSVVNCRDNEQHEAILNCKLASSL